MSYRTLPPQLSIPASLADLILEASVEMAKQAHKAFRISTRRSKEGQTLHPGRSTPLWNELREQLRPHLQKYGAQVNLGRVLGLPRQRINAFITRGTQMPDAERTLQLLAWLIAARSKHPPA